MSKVEDEFHLALECPFYNDLRDDLWRTLGTFCDADLWTSSNGFKFKFLMTGGFGDSEITKKIVYILENMWIRRNL